METRRGRPGNYVARSEGNGLSVMAVSGYRTYERQVYLYQNQVRKVLSRNPDVSSRSGTDCRDDQRDPPGTSEHRIGTRNRLKHRRKPYGEFLPTPPRGNGFTPIVPIMDLSCDIPRISRKSQVSFTSRGISVMSVLSPQKILWPRDYDGRILRHLFKQSRLELLTFPQGIGGIE